MQKYSESIENYIEKILVLSADGNGARVTDIASGLSVSKASVNEIIKKLIVEGLVTHERYKNVFLTEKGERLASKVYEKHETIKSFLKDYLGVSDKNAEEEACRIEHIISDETYEKIQLKMKG